MSGFHRYRVDWTPAGIRGYIDDAQVFAFANEGSGPGAGPFDRRFHLLLNPAVGGDWGGKLGVDADAFPASMQVDYVRVYRLVERRSPMFRATWPSFVTPPVHTRARSPRRPDACRRTQTGFSHYQAVDTYPTTPYYLCTTHSRGQLFQYV